MSKSSRVLFAFNELLSVHILILGIQIAHLRLFVLGEADVGDHLGPLIVLDVDGDQVQC